MPVKEWDVDPTKKSVKIDHEPFLKILQMIDKKYPEKERGDALVFLNGISEITTVAEALKEYAEFSKKWIILILHSTLSVEEQNKVFDIAPTGVRKCILSTNIAETSVTIDEVRFVIDSGKVNLVRYDPISRMHRLAPCWISKASAEQRKGRAGRTGPGVCYRLYSVEQFNKMEPFTPSEIKRVSLESLVLQVLSMNLQINVREFPFVEMPDRDSLEEAVEDLKRQGVISAHDEKSLTPLGTILADLPVDVLVGKMLVYACVLDQVDVTLTMAAGLSVQSPFTNRSFRDYDCVQKRQHLLSDIGDPFTLVKTYREWLKLRSSGEDTRKWARKCGIEESRLFEIMKLRRQFMQILEQSDLIPKKEDKDAGSSRERRIKAGEKRKLRELKKMAGFEEKKRKVLKHGQHFDTIMNVVEEGDQAPTAQDDINSLEFALMKNRDEVSKELSSHKLNETTAILLKMIVAIGIYPQFAVEDPHNNHRIGTDQFAHTFNKPFVVLHPNSALGQMPEALDIPVDDQGQSHLHQLVYFGLLLETTKPFLCNSARIPALFLLIAARNITCKDPQTLSCDGFIEFRFSRVDYCTEVLDKVSEIRRQFIHCVERKLRGDDYRSRELERSIVKFAKSEIPFSIKRNVNPPKFMDNGIFMENGEEYTGASFFQAKDFFNTNEPTEEDQMVDEELDEKKVDEKKLGKKYFCEHCKVDLYFPSNIEILKHKKSHM
uniref:Helicase C-terminal domain-containing protein n=1 Tax=Acrobeloides nanus TaxID=290746 RepID=A0A914C233_9BILA